MNWRCRSAAHWLGSLIAWAQMENGFDPRTLQIPHPIIFLPHCHHHCYHHYHNHHCFYHPCMLKLFRKFIRSGSPICPLKDKLNCWQKRTSWMGWLPYLHTWLLSSPPWRWCQTRGDGPFYHLGIVISYWLSLVLANYWLLLVIVGRSTHFDANLLIYFSCVSPSMKLVSDKGGDWSSWEILAPIQPERAELESVWEIHKCKYTNTPIQIYKYKNTNTQIYKYKYTNK